MHNNDDLQGQDEVSRQVPGRLDVLRTTSEKYNGITSQLCQRLEPVLNGAFRDPRSEPKAERGFEEDLCEVAREIDEAVDAIADANAVLIAIIDHLEI